MPGKVFISCGQSSQNERDVAARIQHWFEDNGFEPYVAINVQTIQDVNSGIISELKGSDYYVFIDCPRDEIQPCDEVCYRGSLFTNQELAIAYVLGFEKVIFLQHHNVKLEGLLRYMASNAIKFDNYSEVSEKLITEVERRSWSTTYSRHLLASKIRWSDEIISYQSLTQPKLIGKFLYVDIENSRSDIAAHATVARLASITYPSGENQISPDRSHLKAAGFPGFSHTIWPLSHAAFDLLCVDNATPNRIFLNSALDKAPKDPIISEIGLYCLNYEVLSSGFPILQFSISLNVTGSIETTDASLY